jgi:Zn-dependent protease
MVFMIYQLLSLVIAVTVHEFAHAFSADRLGDPTPRSQGRLTLNPLKHLDPLGTISILIFRFGWGKPVQFDPYNLEHPRRDTAIISFAGPLSNFAIAILAGLALRTLSLDPNIQIALSILTYTNIMLGVFNLIPVGPLDGQKILAGLLPRDLAYEYDQVMRQYGTILLIGMIIPIFNGQSAAANLILPIINTIFRLIAVA